MLFWLTPQTDIFFFFFYQANSQTKQLFYIGSPVKSDSRKRLPAILVRSLALLFMAGNLLYVLNYARLFITNKKSCQAMNFWCK